MKILMLVVIAISFVLFGRLAIANIRNQPASAADYYYAPSANGDKLSLTIATTAKRIDQQVKSKAIKLINELIGEENRQTWIDNKIEWVNYDQVPHGIPIYPLRNLKHHLMAFQNRHSKHCQEGYANAQYLHEQYPDSFSVPTKQELKSIKIGTIIKVALCGERFWATIDSFNGDVISAIVTNPLYRFEDHGLSNGDQISVKKENIYSVYSE